MLAGTRAPLLLARIAMADATTLSVCIDMHEPLLHSMELSWDIPSFSGSFLPPIYFTSIYSLFVSVVVVQGIKRVESRISIPPISEGFVVRWIISHFSCNSSPRIHSFCEL